MKKTMIKSLKRLFIAIPVPKEWKQSLINIYKKNKKLKDVNWVPDEQYHITATFIGEIEEQKIQNLIETVQKGIQEVRPFELSLETITVAPNERQSKMLWAKLKPSKEYQEISKLIRQHVSDEFQIKEEQRESIPHITLARFRKPVAPFMLELNEQLPAERLEVMHVEIWESDLQNKNERYKRIVAIPLAG